MPSPGPVRYAKSGDTSIAFRCWGAGPIDLVYAPGWLSHLDLDKDNPIRTPFIEALASFARVICFDKRGMGLSDRDEASAPLEVRVDDLRAVMDAAGSEKAAVVGFSDGGQMAIMFAATHPERVQALVLVASAAYFADQPQLGLLFEIIDNAWGEGRLAQFIGPGAEGVPEWVEASGLYERAAASPRAARRVLEAQAGIDLRPVLPTLSVPTLVIHADADPLVDVSLGRHLAEHIPGARFLSVSGQSHYPWLLDLWTPVSAIQELLTGTRQRLDVDRVLATLLFTDIVGSTEQAASMGDRPWRSLLDQHHRVVRQQLSLFRGREVKTTGDGFLATFDGPARAVRCACAIRDAVGTLGLQVRVGLHTGEVELQGDDLAGIAVHVAARVGAMASAGEILVSRTVADLVAGSGLEFSVHGDHDLKGVPGRWPLLAVAAGNTRTGE
jgi:class 3 adenylate cyclase